MLKEKILERIRTTFICFFRNTIYHYTQDPLTLDDKILCVFCMQQSLELLLKYAIVEEDGYEKIIYKNDIKKSESELISMLNEGELRTKGYGELLNDVKEGGYFSLSSSDYLVISEFQKARNQIAHMGFEFISDDLLNGIVQILVSVFTDLEYKERLSQVNEEDMVNVLRLMLGNNLYFRLINKQELRDEAEKKVKKLTDNPYYCMECESKSVYIDNSNTEAYKCILYGFRVGTAYAATIKCPVCESNSMYFDTLNISPSNDVNGHCISCGANLSISQCDECGDYYVADLGSCSCGKHNIK